MKKNVLLIGCGNPLRSDDGMAHELIHRFESLKDPLLEQVEIEESHQLTPEMAESASRVARVIIVDAQEGGVPGKVNIRQVHAAGDQAPGGLSHDFDPGALLRTTRHLFGENPETYVVSISAQHFDHGEELSATVNAAIPEALEAVRALISTTNHEGEKNHA